MMIGKKQVGGNAPVFIIAELSANHLGDYNIAKDTIKMMADSGADAVKVQTYTAETMTLKSDKKYFKIKQGTVWDGRTLYDLYEEAHMPWKWQEKLKAFSESLALEFFSSPFDKSSVDFLEGIEVPAYKIASFEITDIPLIEYVASKKKALIMSTGIATISDIDEALRVSKENGAKDIALLKCTSAYPAPLEEMNIKTISDMSKRFNVIAGLSDHSLTTSVPVAACALGAKIIEKHFTSSRSLGGADAAFSLEPKEFENMVCSVREAEKAIGNVTYELSEKTLKNREFSRSLFITENLKKGDVITEKNIRSVRPAFGLAPKHYKEALGKRLKEDVEMGTPLTFDLLE